MKKKIFSLSSIFIFAILLLVCSNPPAPWIRAYFEILNRNKFTATHLRLIDVDFDGVPEMFLLSMEADDDSLIGFTYKDGKVTTILNGHRILPELQAYRHTETNQVIWTARQTYNYDGPNSSQCSRITFEKIDFSDIRQVKRSFFLEYNRILTVDSENYTLTDANGYTKESSSEQVSAYIANQLAQYEEIEPLRMYSAIDVFFSDPADLNKTLKLKRFVDFASLYKAAHNEARAYQILRPARLPLRMIQNDELFTIIQQREPISLFDKYYGHTEPTTGTSIYIEYSQIQHFNRLAIQQKLNRLIRKSFFDDWDIYSQNNLRLRMYQEVHLYKEQYLSFCNYKIVNDETKLSGIVLNLQTGKKAQLDDFIVINKLLHEKILQGAFICNQLSQDECLKNDYYKKLSQAISDRAYRDSHFYVTYEGKLGIILDAPYYRGEYIVFEALLGDLMATQFNYQDKAT